MTYTPDQIARAQEIVDWHTLSWGWGPLSEFQGTSEYDLAIQAALAAIAATEARVTERAAKEADTWPGNGCEIAAALRANHHLKDRPDAG